jgi:hypothetical protein
MMSKNVILVLIYHRHKLLDLIYLFSVLAQFLYEHILILYIIFIYVTGRIIHSTPINFLKIVKPTETN